MRQKYRWKRRDNKYQLGETVFAVNHETFKVFSGKITQIQKLNQRHNMSILVIYRLEDDRFYTEEDLFLSERGARISSLNLAKNANAKTTV